MSFDRSSSLTPETASGGLTMPTTRTSQFVRSVDGTRIAFDRTGNGPPLVLVEAAGHFRAFSSFDGLTPLLAPDFTVITYDRRARGESGDTPPYVPAREVEDLAALIDEAGGPAHVYGYSSGALLGLHAAAAGLPIGRLALLEPPLQDDDAPRPDPLTGELAELVDAGRSTDAVDHFQRSIGVPDEYLTGMRESPAWAHMVSAARSLVYDCMLSDATTSDLLRSVATPTLVLDSQGSTDDLSGWAASVARALPDATHRSLPGEWHGVADEVLAPVLRAFFDA
jgi:pimeloyl-ACP methyl ester carboxylesterase